MKSEGNIRNGDDKKRINNLSEEKDLMGGSHPKASKESVSDEMTAEIVNHVIGALRRKRGK